MNEDSKIKDFIKVYQGAIPKNICLYMLKELESADWKLHNWTQYHLVIESLDKQTELSVCYLSKLSTLQVQPIIVNYVKNYCSDKSFLINGLSNLRANRYDAGTSMKGHIDHIHSIFDGNKKGIPTLSIVCALNDDFEGGNFVFFDNFSVDLKQGDILIFPSNFLYPHRVETVVKGTRYSIVQWVY